MNNNQAISNLKELDAIFRELGVEYWLSNGTLLGVYRDNKLIDSDANTDISVNVKTISKDMFQKIKAANFSPVRFFGKLQDGDRKSTRLNSSHVRSSYAVFCLK